MSVCRGCGKEIIFLRTIAGKSMPCDPEAVHFRMTSRFDKEAIENFVMQDGAVCRGVRDPLGKWIGYRSHWATCTEAGRFRRSRG